MTISDSCFFSRNAYIDILRGLCIISVILLHLNLHIPFQNSALGHSLSSEEIKILFWSGYYGVIIFFVLSGFLITLTSMRRWGSLEHVQYSQFYWMRFARIMPCLIGLLIILSILDVIHLKNFTINPQRASLPQAIFSALTFHLNYLEAQKGYLPGAWDILWSLSIEEMFYLFFPLLCRIIKNEKFFVLAMGVFIILGPFARSVFSHNDIWQDKSYLSCIDAIAFGCLAAVFTYRIKLSNKSQAVFLISGLAFSLFIIIFRKQAYEWGISSLGLNVTFLEMGIALILLSAEKFPQKIPGTALLQYFGKNSYEIYLTHMFVIVGLTELFYKLSQSHKIILLLYLTTFFLSGLLGQLIAKYYSKPINKVLRNKFLLST